MIYYMSIILKKKTNINMKYIIMLIKEMHILFQKKKKIVFLFITTTV